jgi:ABC-type branched-subunit amino acid transport system ATPase component
MSAVAPVLETRGLTKAFGGFVATDDVSLALTRGARHALIGPNGAGKTTLINLLTGVLAPTRGTVRLEGADITGLSRHARVRRGLARTFQINQLFREMTPLEAVAMAVAQHEGRARVWWRPANRETAVADEAAALLSSLGLADVLARPTAELAYGKQRLIELALALACRPRVLLLDEPAAGVPHGERDEILAVVAALPRAVTVLLIEHDMDLVFRFAERITVLVQGRLLVEGTPEEVAADPRVRQVYLGEQSYLGGGAHG